MEAIKWIISLIIGLTVTMAGIGLAIAAVIVSTFIKIIGLFGIVAAGIAMVVKEKIDARSDKND